MYGVKISSKVFLSETLKKKENVVKFTLEILWKQHNSKQQFFTVLPEIRNVVLWQNYALYIFV